MVDTIWQSNFFATRYDSMLPWREQGRPGREKMKKKKKKKKTK